MLTVTNLTNGNLVLNDETGQPPSVYIPGEVKLVPHLTSDISGAVAAGLASVSGTDILASELVANTPGGNVAATTTQGAITELDTEKAKLNGDAALDFATRNVTSAQNSVAVHHINTRSVSIVNSNTGVTLTAAQIATHHVSRTGTAVAPISDTLPTAALLLAQFAKAGVGQGFEFTIGNNTGQVLTVLLNTGITMAGTVTIATGTRRTFVLTFTNVTPSSEAATCFGLL